MNEREAFEAALGIADPGERSTFLDQACGRDTDVRRNIDRMLGVQHKLGSFLEHPAIESIPTEVLVDTTGAREGAAAGGRTTPHLDDISLHFLEPARQPDSIGRLGQYDILEVVGRGGMGIVLKAHDTKLNRVVAVKLLAPELASNPTARKRFAREAQTAAAVSHENIVTIHAVDAGEPQSLPFLVMEFIDGESLQDKIDRQGQLELKEVLRIGRQVAASLAAAHEQGLIHRDVKPSNVLLQNGVQRVKITDFGLARAVDDVGITNTGQVAGTPPFMSPEQAQGQPVDARSDLFSLGSVLYAMCTGRSPFRADTTVASLRRVCDGTPRPIREVNPDIPEWLVEIIDRLLEKKPEDRFQTAAEAAQVLGQHLAHLQDPASSPFPGAVQPIRLRQASAGGRRRWLVSAAAALVLIAALMGATEATGVTHLQTTVIRLVYGEGTLVIEVADPNVSVTIDGRDLVITGAGPKQLRLTPGSYQVTATKDGRLVKTELVTLIRGGRKVVSVTVENVVSVRAAQTGNWTGDYQAVRDHQNACAKHLGVPVEFTNSMGMKLRLIPPGEFVMGTPVEHIRRLTQEAEQLSYPIFMVDTIRAEWSNRRVRISRPFYIGVHEVTVGDFRRFVESTGYSTDGEKQGDGGWGSHEGKWTRRREHVWKTPGTWVVSDDQPVVHVSWNDATAFCRWLSDTDGIEYVLPTEAQWEFAARAGTTGLYFSSDNPTILERVAWTEETLPPEERHPQPIAEKAPNRFGLYDMLGNVWEFCSDWYAGGLQNGSLTVDPRGPRNGESRVLRGGAWYLSRILNRCGTRGYAAPDKAWDAGTGFRVAVVGDLRKVAASAHKIDGSQAVDAHQQPENAIISNPPQELKAPDGTDKALRPAASSESTQEQKRSEDTHQESTKPER